MMTVLTHVGTLVLAVHSHTKLQAAKEGKANRSYLDCILLVVEYTLTALSTYMPFGR
jgi:hypothetical protein